MEIKVKCPHCHKLTPVSLDKLNQFKYRNQICGECGNLFESKYLVKSRAKKTKLSKTQNKILIDDLVETWSYLVKARSGFRCELNGINGHYCDNTNLQSHHIAGKSSQYLKLLLINGICICESQHMLVSIGNTAQRLDVEKRIIAVRKMFTRQSAPWATDIYRYLDLLKIENQNKKQNLNMIELSFDAEIRKVKNA